ncbi:ImmA/IrrE family metallo-endopeptidase [Streptococcus parasanguinis]|uniref:ImmA/IrrE family metallo-endopeptidase n=1 Tax=Streptococcus parasanguinis TaxID=1318 RepID=UPI0032191517
MLHRSFEKLLESNFYNIIFKAVDNFIYTNKSNLSVKSHTITDPNYKKLDDFSIKKVLSRKTEEEFIVSELQVIANLEIKGYTQYGYDSDSSNIWLRIKVIYKLEQGIHDFKVMSVIPFDSSDYDASDLGLSPEFVPYVKAKEMDDIAEEILRQYFPDALQVPMALPIDEYLENIGLTKVEGKLTKDSSVFGEMVFKDTEVVFYDSDKPETKLISKKTILVDPNVICLRNQGSYNNTVVHESVHWLLHRYHNEYKMLFDTNHRLSSSKSDRSSLSSSTWSDYDWMEWQANGIAARILMPKKTTKQMVQEFFVKYSLEFEQEKKTLMFEQVVDDLADFFHVSRLAVKIRLLQLGYSEFEGVYNYVGNEYIKSYAFEVGALNKGQAFTISFNNACMLNATNSKFKELMNSERFVYVDSHFCLNDEKYVEMVDLGIYQMTDYAYEHMDECCLTFDVRYQTDGTLSYKDFNDYVMYRGSNPELKIKVDFSECLISQEILGNVPEYTAEVYTKVAEVMEQLPGNFCGTMVYHRKRRDFTREELEEHSTVSVSTIQRMETDKEYQKQLGRLMGICIGLKLYPTFSFDLIDKSNCKFDDTIVFHGVYKMLLRNCYHLTVDECNEKLKEMGIPVPIGGK